MNQKKLFTITLCAAVCCLMFSACEPKENIRPIEENIRPLFEVSCHCGTNDPLNQLLWLHRQAAYFETLRGKCRASISICKYDSDKDGFLITDCEECPDRGLDFVDCNGNGLGLLFGFSGTPYEAYKIDPSSVRCIYRNYTDEEQTIVGRWHLMKFVDRLENITEAPVWNGDTLSYWLEFTNNGKVFGGGCNYLNGTYTLQDDRININIHSGTEIYDASGWEDKMLEALNAATICDIDLHGNTLRLYYNDNTQYLEFKNSQIQ